MRPLRFLLLSLVSFTLLACAIAPSPALQGNPIPYLPALHGDYFKIDSRSVGRPFHIFVRLPEGYASNKEAKYPVVYLLDGDSLFPILAANHLFLNYDYKLPEAIVVGIAYGSFDPTINKRGYDFSAPAADASGTQGGAPAFHKFLRAELIPRIEKQYRADSEKRILFGQSRGGYLVLHSAYTDPDLFWGRIASNPSMDPGRNRFFSAPSPAQRKDLGLVVTSGSEDYPYLRDLSLELFKHMRKRADLPWDFGGLTIQGGKHASNSPDSYRVGMLWLFNRKN